VNQRRDDLPLVSIVTPSFNQGRFIAETIESVLTQDYPNIEYLVIDGVSTDNTLDVLRSYGDRVSWLSEPDMNQSDAINKGISRTHGAIVTWLNSDDLLLPGAVSRIVKEFSGDNSLGLVYGASRLIDVDGGEIGYALSLEPDLWMMLHVADHVPQPSAFFRRAALERVGQINESLRYCMDYELFIRLFVDGPVRRIPDILSESRVHDSTISLTGGFARFREIGQMVRTQSRRRFPPAIANYAIDWAEHATERLFRRINAGNLTLRALGAIQRLSTAGYRIVLTRANPRWADGWIGSNARFLVRRSDGPLVEIRGEVPRSRGHDQPQRLEISADGMLLDRIVLPRGPFRLVYSLPSSEMCTSVGNRSPAIDRTHRLEVRARWAAPERPSSIVGVHSRLDRRSISWRLDSLIGCTTDDLDHLPTYGWFGDGWASPNLSAFVSASSPSIRIKGRLPQEIAQLRDQTLRIEINGTCVHDGQLAIGPFEYEYAVQRGRIAVVHLTASMWFDPSEDNPNDGTRRLAFLLDSINGQRTTDTGN
jgi:glycosyltransferase involved in cell wall biosynthesis